MTLITKLKALQVPEKGLKIQSTHIQFAIKKP